MKFSEKLKSIRTRLELSQDDLASIINVSRQAITKWETGVGLPDIENLKVLTFLLLFLKHMFRFSYLKFL